MKEFFSHAQAVKHMREQQRKGKSNQMTTRVDCTNFGGWVQEWTIFIVSPLKTQEVTYGH